MQVLTLVCVGLCALSGNPDSPEGEFPYIAYIAKSHADVRSGPGIGYYSTGQLNRSDQVEVYREDAGGWLAIRPPEGSFSWVSARQLRVADEPDVAEVLSERAAAWVGTRAGSVRDHKWQVQLVRGELVELLGERVFSIHAEADVETWYKIAPPAGEFRWVSREDVSRETPPPVEEVKKQPIQLASHQIVVAPSRAGDNTSASGFVATRSDTGGARDASAATKPREGDDQWWKTSRVEDFDDNLGEIQIELSLLAARNPDHWQLAGLRNTAQGLAEKANKPADRDRAQNLLATIGEFEDLHDRFEKWKERWDVPTDVSGDSSPEQGELDPNSQVVAAAALVDPRFDGVGWLMSVHSTKRAAPPYALLDDDGGVVCYVTPAPGLNLRRYVRKAVGIVGQRSYLPALQTTHLTAHRIVVLDRHKR